MASSRSVPQNDSKSSMIIERNQRCLRVSVFTSDAAGVIRIMVVMMIVMTISVILAMMMIVRTNVTY